MNEAEVLILKWSLVAAGLLDCYLVPLLILNRLIKRLNSA